jgi:hypothetical protein
MVTIRTSECGSGNGRSSRVTTLASRRGGGSSCGYRSCSLILAAVEKASRLGTYRRVGMLVMPTELEDPEKFKLQILDSLDWRQEVVTII